MTAVISAVVLEMGAVGIIDLPSTHVFVRKGLSMQENLGFQFSSKSYAAIISFQILSFSATNSFSW